MLQVRSALFLNATIAVCLTAGYASAITFTGATDNTWEDPTNWNTGVLPAPTDRTRFSVDAIVSTPQTVGQFWSDSGGGSVTVANGGVVTTGTGNPSIDFRAGANLTIQDGGTVISQRRLRWTNFPALNPADTLAVNAGGTLSALRGNFGIGTFQIAGDATFDIYLRTGDSAFATSTAVLDLQPGGTLYADTMEWDGAATVTVGNGSTLALGNNAHTITDGLTIQSGGTLASGKNAATPSASISGGALTLESGAIIDYSVNGLSDTSDQWTVDNLNITGGAGSVTLLMDMVAGDYKQSDPDLTIFSWTSSGPADESFLTLVGAEGTNIKTEGTLLYLGDASAGSIVLSGFEAFAIPEPSTGMLFGIGGLVMFLRRRIIRR